MAAFEHLLRSYDVSDQLDDIASADPPAYLRRCFAEGISTPVLPWARAQQLAVCAMVLDAILHNREYGFLEPELVADWRIHYGVPCSRMKDTAIQALHRIVERDPPQDADAIGEVQELATRLDSV